MTAVLIIAGALMSGCRTPGVPEVPMEGNVARLMARPDAETARDAAPDWVRDALKTVLDLETELAKERIPE